MTMGEIIIFIYLEALGAVWILVFGEELSFQLFLALCTPFK
jgi:hypothetical protein